MYIEVITPTKVLYKGDADMAEFPGEDGSFQVLENHAPLMSVLALGKVSLSKGGHVYETYDISSGYVEVKENNVTVLINEAI
ncbi:ATP synthase F1 subunit epsilon [Saccharicrinis sp. FJH2]|uniref:ATP synthase F1 subunit epsilon n=1 Tax=unclassified Saccharicrinis TaxID=2646859 RepID=UPI0035D5021F